MLLVVAIVLLAANLVVMFGVYGASPAHAQTGRTCVGMAVAVPVGAQHQKDFYIYRCWSDGTIQGVHDSETKW